MATRYRVQGPDGAIHVLEGPDDASPAQIEAFAAQTIGKAAQKPAVEPGLPSITKPPTPPGPSSGVFGGDDVASQIFPVEAPVAKRQPSAVPEMRAYEPSFVEKIGALIPGNKAQSANEYAARQIAKEQNVSIDEAYKQMKEGLGVRGASIPILSQAMRTENRPSGQPMWNPEGRAPIKAGIEALPYAAEGVLDLPKGMAESAIRAYRAGDIESPTKEGALESVLGYLSDPKTEILIPNIPKLLGLNEQDRNYQPLLGLGKSFGYSLTTLVASSVAASLATEATGPLGGLTAGMAASGTVAYRASKDDFLDRLRDKLNNDSMKLFNRPMNSDEWAKAKDEFNAEAVKYGLWEAVPEALSNAIFLKAFASPAKTASSSKLAGYAEKAQSYATENLTETVTALGQNAAELKAGLTKDELTIADAFKQQFIQTLLTMGVTAGALKGKQLATDFYQKNVEPAIAPQSALGRAIKADLDSLGFSQEANRQEAVRRLSPDRAQMELVPEAGIASLRPAVAPAPPEEPPIPGEEFKVTLSQDLRSGIQSGVASIDPDLRDLYALQLERKLGKNGVLLWSDIPQDLNSAMDTASFGALKSAINLNPEEAIALVRGDQNVAPQVEPEVSPAATPAATPIEAPSTELARQVLPDDSQDYEAMIQELEAQMEGKPEPKVEAPMVEAPKVEEPEVEEAAVPPSRNLGLGESLEDYESINNDAVKMTREEFKDQHEDENYDKELWRAYRADKLSLDEVKARSATTETGSKYFWAKTPQELDQEMKLAIGAAKGQKLALNQLQSSPEFAQWRINSMKGNAAQDVKSAVSYYDNLKAIHKERVQEALDEGKPVPQEILDIYKLTKGAAATAPAAAPKPTVTSYTEPTAPAEAAADVAERVAPYVQRFESGNFSLPGNISGTGTEGRKVAEEQNKQASQDYAQAVKVFLEGSLTTKPPTKKQDKLDTEFVQGVNPQPIPKSISAKTPTTFDGQLKAIDAIAAKQDPRNYLNGYHIDPDKKFIVATDGHRMAVLKKAILEGMPTPVPGASVLGRDNQWVAGLRFPDYERVIPKEGRSEKMTVDAVALGDYARSIVKAGKYLASEFNAMPLTDGNVTSYINAAYIADMADVFRRFGYTTFTVELGAKEGDTLSASSPDGKLVQVVMPMRRVGSPFVAYDLTGGKQAAKPAKTTKKAEPKVEKKVEAPAEKPTEAAEPEMTSAQISAQLKKLMMESVRAKEPNADRDKEIDRLIKMQKALEEKKAPPKPKEDIEALKAELKKLRDKADSIGPAAKKAGIAAFELENKLRRLGVEVAEEEEVQEAEIEEEGVKVIPFEASVEGVKEALAEFKEVDDPRLEALFNPDQKPARPQIADEDVLTPEEAADVIDGWKAEAVGQGASSINANRTVLSLFDASGEWAKPWAEAGYNVVTFDLTTGQDINDFSAEMLLEEFGNDNIWAILAAPPCTDYSSSGAQFWKKKDEDGRTEVSNELVRQVLRTVELFRPAVWAMENPVGRIAKLTGLPPAQLTFSPQFYGDPYTKKTLLWGSFNNELPLAWVEPTEGSKIAKISGKDKYARSLTPEGFAYAFFMANNAEGMSAQDRLSREFHGVGREYFKDATNQNEEEVRSSIQDSYYDGDLQAVREILQGKAEPTENSPAYEKALEESRQASRDFAEVQRAYRAKEIGDEEFIAGRKVYDAAMAKFDEAYANEQSVVQNFAIETPEGATLRYPVAYNLVQDGYKVLALDDPRTYIDKGNTPHRTFEKGPLRIAVSPQKTLFVNNNRVQTGFGNSDEMVLEAILVDQDKRGKGLATEAMQELVANADKHGITLYIEPTPLVNIKEKNFGLDKQQLDDFYKKFGFEFQEGTERVMVREPQLEVLGPAEKPIAEKLGYEPYTIEGEFTEIGEAEQHKILEGPVSKLSEDQTKTLEKEYGVDRDTTEFLDRVRKDVIDFVTKGATAVHGKIRAIIRQLANGVLSVAVVFNPQFVSKPYTIAVPQFDVRTSEVLAEVPQAARAKMSDAAQRAYGVIYPAMEKTLKEKDKFFIVSDKRSGNTFFFNPDGSLLLDTKTLFGVAVGDFMKGDNEIVANRITPAGVFDLGLRDAKRSEGEARTAGEYDFGKVFVLDKSYMGRNGPYSNTIMHSVWLQEDDAKKRLAALDKPGAEDSRYSFGCINVNKETFRNLVTNHLSQMDGAKIFIVPENGTNVMDFVNGKATYSDDIIRQRVEPVTKTTKVPVKETTKRERPGETLARTEEEGIPLENVAADQTKTAAFKKWFKDSQVVNADGNPQVVYHATNASFDAFDPQKRELGFHFGSVDAASKRAKEIGIKDKYNVIPVYLSLQNPYDIVSDLGNWSDMGMLEEYLSETNEGPFTNKEFSKFKNSDDVRKGLQAKGYDGISYINNFEDQGSLSFIAFEPSQIKSAIGNRGTFDVNEPSILANVERKLPPGRSPQLAAAAQMVQEGTMTAAEYDELVNFYKPIRKYEEPLKPATREQVYEALDSAKREKISPDIANGTKVGLRLDIPAFNRKGVYVVSIHQKGTKSGPGKVIGYDSVAMVNNVTFGLGRETDALKIAAGAAKDALQTIEGDYNKVTPEEATKLAKEALTDPAWVQIGIDPTRHSYFYDRETTEPVVAAEQVLQIGNMVLGKNVTYGNKADYLFNKNDRFNDLMDKYNEYLKTQREIARQDTIKAYAKLRRRRSALTTKVVKGGATLTLQQELTQVSQLANELRESIEDSKPDRRTAGDFDTKARVALNNGEITQEVYDVIQAAYAKFPALLEGLKLSIVKEENKGTSGQFLPVARIVRLYKNTSGTADPVTVRHELVHSLEQMMDADARNVIITAWEKDLKTAMKKYTAENGYQDHEDYFKAVMRFMRNPTMETFREAQALLPSYEMYQYLNPSEYWAVNGEKLMARQLGSGWDRFVNIVKRLFEGLKKVFGFDNKYAVHKMFADIVGGKMERMNKSSLVNYVANSRNIALENMNYKGGPAPLAQWTSPDESKMDAVIYKFQDKLIDTKRVIQSIQKSTGQIAENWDAYMKEELYHGRTAKAVNDFLNKDMLPILEEMKDKNITLPQLDEYLHNRHAQERNDQIAMVNPAMPDSGSGISTADAQAYLANLTPDQQRDFGSIAAKIDSIVRGTQNLLVNTGLETQDTIDSWNKAYSNYVPLMRADLDFIHHGSGMGSGYGTKGKFSKRATGSYKDVVDIFANIALQRERAIIRSEKARVGRALYGLTITAPNPGFWLPVNPAAIKNKQKLTNELIGLGLSPADAANLIMEPKVAGFDKATGLVKYQVNPAMRNSDNVFSVRINGEDRFVFFNTSDPRALRMVQAMKNLDAEQLGLALGTVGQVTRWIAAVNTQYNPVFGAWNFTRDVGGAAFNLSTTPLAGKQKEVMKNVFPALFGIYGQLREKPSAAQNQWSQLFEKYQQAGGQTGFKEQFSKGLEKASIVERELKKLDRGNVRKATAAIFDWLSDYNDAMENAVRLAAFKVALDQNLSNDKAASIAKNLTVNFNRKGASSPILQALYAFVNASVQGTVRVGQTITGPAGKKIMAGGVILGVVQALALALAGYDDGEPPDFVKDKNLVLPLPGGSYLMVPMPLGYNVFPGVGRLTTEYVLGQMGFITGAKSAGSKIGSAASLILDSFNPLGSGSLIQVLAPTVVDPIAAIATNKDAFGRPISKEDRATNPTPGYTRSRENASAFSQGLAMFLNWATSPVGTSYTKGAVSPTADQIDYLIGQYTGGVGREIVKASDYISSKFTGEEVQPYRVPIVGKLYGETESPGAISAKFYENVTKMAVHENEIKALIKNRESAAEYKADHPDWRFYNRANYLENQITAINAQKKALRERDAPEERIKKLDERKTAMMKKFNDQIKEAQ
jgi:site-specific DNA-cytosine methylase